jgi:hypothetical protein
LLSPATPRLLAMPRPHRLLGELAYLRLQKRHPFKAALQAGQVGATLYELAVLAEKLGDWPTRDQYRQATGRSPRTVTRDWSLVREAFGLDPTDDLHQLGDWILAERSKKRAQNAKQLEALPAPEFLPALRAA